MKAVWVLFVLFVWGAAFVSSQGFQGLENVVDPTPFLQNPVFLKRQLACMLGTGPCDFIGRYLRGAAVEVLTRRCRYCSRQQKLQSSRMVNFLRTNYPKEYAQIYRRYRP